MISTAVRSCLRADSLALTRATRFARSPDLWTKGKMSKKAYLKRLKKAYGVEPYVTCGGGRDTRSSLLTVSVCIESATREIAACPEAVLKANAKRCPEKLVIERGNGSVKSVSQECRAYY